MARRQPQPTERRATVEHLRKEQARKERTRSFAFLGISVLAVAVLITAALVPYLKDKRENHRIAALKIESIGVSAAAAGCGDVTTESAQMPGNLKTWHVPVGQPLTYDAMPPSFGKHWEDYPGSPTGPASRQFWTSTDRPAVEYLVHAEEHGHTILWYDDTIKPGSTAYKDLQMLGERLSAADAVTIAPWTSKDGTAFTDGMHVALTHWTGGADTMGVREFCKAPSGAVLKSFMKDYPKSNSPEPQAP